MVEDIMAFIRMILMGILFSCVFWANRVLFGTSSSSAQPVTEQASAALWRYMPFDEAMETSRYPRAVQITERVVGIDGHTFLEFCKELYEKNNPLTLPVSATPIPKIIHQVWIGGAVPEAFVPYMQTWTRENFGDDWEYKLWTDKEVETLDLYNRAFYDLAETPGVKSDILKWELVYKFGGVYVDVDYLCLNPELFNLLHSRYDFYTGLQPLDTQYAQLGAALFGATPGHPILKHCIETIKDDWHKKGAPAKTGPIHFTRSFYLTAGLNGSKDAALPARYLYPMGCTEHELKIEEWVRQGSPAVHVWAKSWMPAKYRPQQFKHLNNDHITVNWNE